MLPKHFTFYCTDDHARMIYTAKKQSDGLFKVTWKDSDNWMEYDESGMKYCIDNGNWRIITCIDDEEPKEEIVEKSENTLPTEFYFKLNPKTVVSGHHGTVFKAVQFNDDNNCLAYDVYWDDGRTDYSYENVKENIDYGDWLITEIRVQEQPHEGPAYLLSEAQAFCAANEAALVISENKFVLSHPGSGISYCVPSAEDLQRAMQWLRDFLAEKNFLESKKEEVNA